MSYRAFLFFLVMGCGFGAKAQQFATRSAHIAFLSETPLEDIQAESHEASSIFDAATGQIAFQVPILSFHFPKALMEEHFNENYMESEQFPKASFRGTVSGLDTGAQGEQEVTAKGELEMHGVALEREVKGTMTRSETGWSIVAAFSVPCTDHDIDIPKVVSENIAEIIEVTLSANLEPR
jgi:hypothetical protein